MTTRKQKSTRRLQQQTSWEVWRINGFILLTHGLSVMKFRTIRSVGLRNASLRIWHLAEFKIRLLFFTNELGFSVEIHVGLTCGQAFVFLLC